MSNVASMINVLAIDSDPAYLNRLRVSNGLKALNGRLQGGLWAESGLAVSTGDLRALQDVQIVVMSTDTFNPPLLPLIAQIRRVRPVIPILVAHSGSEKIDRRELNRLSVSALISKPRSFAELSLSINVLKGAKSPTVIRSVGPTETPDAREFVAVSIGEFLAEYPSFFDVYLRLPSGRFLPVLLAGDSMEIARVLEYREKGVTHFYISKSGLGACLTYCDQLARTLIANVSVNSELRLFHLVHGIKEWLEALPSGQEKVRHINEAADLIGDLTVLLKDGLDKDRQRFMDSWAQKSHLLEHSISVTVGSLMLALQLGFEGSDRLRSLGLGALFHDLGLAEGSTGLLNEDRAKMSKTELAEFEAHPARGAELVRGVPRWGELAATAILGHHERRTGIGFPLGMGAREIHLFAQLIGIMDEYFRRKAQGVSPTELTLQMKRDVYPGFSLPVIKAFQQAFTRERTALRSKVAGD